MQNVQRGDGQRTAEEPETIRYGEPDDGESWLYGLLLFPVKRAIPVIYHTNEDPVDWEISQRYPDPI